LTSLKDITSSSPLAFWQIRNTSKFSFGRKDFIVSGFLPDFLFITIINHKIIIFYFFLMLRILARFKSSVKISSRFFAIPNQTDFLRINLDMKKIQIDNV